MSSRHSIAVASHFHHKFITLSLLLAIRFKVRGRYGPENMLALISGLILPGLVGGSSSNFGKIWPDGPVLAEIVI